MLAGGTDLLVSIRSGLACPRVVFDISDLAPCRDIIEKDDHLRIGAAVRMTEIVKSALVTQSAVARGGSPPTESLQIRNRATLGGNMVAASPSRCRSASSGRGCDVGAVWFEWVGPSDSGTFPEGARKTSLGEHVLTEVVIPLERSGYRSRFVKVGRRKAQACSVINLAGGIDIGQDGLVRDVRIALGAVAPTVMRARRAEEALTGRAPSTKKLPRAAALAGEECRPISDVRATGSGRRLLVEAWTFRLLQALCEAG